MSSALAIAGVSVVLRDLLINGLIDHDLAPSLRDVEVTALPPDKVNTGPNAKSQLNLFMYRVAPNLGWRNEFYPELDKQGRRVANPPLALDLWYLLSAYGVQDFHGEILLGYAMQLLHETPVLARQAIRTALAAPPVVGGGGGLPDELRQLAVSGLADQLEQIKIVLAPQDTEELSRLWSATQSNYRPTAVYHVSVVLIERDRSTRPSLPVRERRLHVRQLQRPVIDSVEPQYLEAGGSLSLSGSGFRNDHVAVRFGESIVTLSQGEIGDSSINVNLPANLRAGINTVQVVHSFDFGTPDSPHKGPRSNPVAFVLRPKAEVINGVDWQVETDGDYRNAKIPLRFAPAVGRSQKVALHLNQLNAPAGSGPTAYSFNAPPLGSPDDGPVTDITIPVKKVLKGKYLFRVEVDGGESRIEPATGAAQSPHLELL